MMTSTKRAISTNTLTNSPHCAEILTEYNRILAAEGRVNNLKFLKEFIQPRMPGYTQSSWYNFLKRFNTSVGLVVQNKVQNLKPESEAAITTLEATMMGNQEATQTGIRAALNIGAKALKDLMENIHLLSPKDRAELLFKAMKAQDSRIHSLGKIREDNREQAKFDRAFDSAAYEQ